VLVDRPDKLGRIAILEVHLKKASLFSDVRSDEIAALTPGFTGADLANLVNEAALLATRDDSEYVEMKHFNLAIERIVAGLEKRNRLLNPHERKVTAYHEIGHALVARTIPGSDPIHKVSIIPRGIAALGYTIQRPIEDRFLMSRGELADKMAILLGGHLDRCVGRSRQGDRHRPQHGDPIRNGREARSRLARERALRVSSGTDGFRRRTARFLGGDGT
jgi:cell division protease FtsH